MIIIRHWFVEEASDVSCNLETTPVFMQDKGSWRVRNLIKIGIEATRGKLRCDLLSHPARYFSLLVRDNRAALCIRSCDSQGEDITMHIIDGLVSDANGDLVSVFEEAVREAVIALSSGNRGLCEDGRYPISSRLERIISSMPDLIDWTISSALAPGRNILLSASWDV